MPEAYARLPLSAKLALGARIWVTFASVRLRLHTPLPELVDALAAAPAGAGRGRPEARRLGSIVHRTLRIGHRRPTCLLSALVLFKLLRGQGEAPTLVIGLPHDAVTKNAHSWIELDGRDVGPPPGRLGHMPLARYPDATTTSPR